MKSIFTFCGIIFIILSINLLSSCKKDKSSPTPPAITTAAITDINYTTATSGGNVTDEGSSAVLSMGICWNTSPNPVIQNSKTSENVGLGPFVSSISELIQNTKYYVRAYATNSVGTSYGNEVSFTTTANSIPVLTTTTVTSINLYTAISGGNISSDGGSAVTGRGVCWSIINNPTISNSKTSDSLGSGVFISKITGLSKGTTYHVRSYATNSIGTSYGLDLSFSTPEMEWVKSTNFPGTARWMPLSFTYNG
ncbi:MAG TPA: hypothetical protein VFE71_04795, partial [Bacteroidales bacterium]|nr:hypothetical protein [Bacteroidales bacterium]